MWALHCCVYFPHFLKDEMAVSGNECGILQQAFQKDFLQTKYVKCTIDLDKYQVSDNFPKLIVSKLLSSWAKQLSTKV